MTKIYSRAYQKENVPQIGQMSHTIEDKQNFVISP